MTYAVNHVPLIDLSKSTTNCCALIDPAAWDEQEIVFNDKLFAHAKVRSFLHVPLNMAQVMGKTQAMIEEAGVSADEFLTLSSEASPWHSDHYVAIRKDVPGLETTKLSGRFMTKVFEGPFKDAQIWHTQLIEYVRSRGKTPLKTYFFYTTCPTCAKVYGKNYVVGFEEIAEGE